MAYSLDATMVSNFFIVGLRDRARLFVIQRYL